MPCSFGAPVTTNTLARADAWADAAISALLPRIYQGFGVVQLMVGQKLAIFRFTSEG